MQRKTREQRSGGTEGENDRVGGSVSKIMLPHDYGRCQGKVGIFGSD